MIFVSFKQSYDSINRQNLWIVTKKLEISEKLVKMLKICDSNTLDKVRGVVTTILGSVCIKTK